MSRNQNARPGRKVRIQTAYGTLALAVALAFTGCDAGTGPQLSRVKIQLTDAPSDIIETAEVWISQVYLQGGGEDDDSTSEGTGRVELFNDSENPFYVDLLTLRDGITADLTPEVPVDVGLYQGLRFIVDSTRVTLIEGVSFEDGSQSATLFVPSGSQSGIKVKLDDILETAEDQTTTIVVDFDVDANFVIQGTQGPEGVRRILFTPVLKEKSRSRDDS